MNRREFLRRGAAFAAGLAAAGLFRFRGGAEAAVEAGPEIVAAKGDTPENLTYQAVKMLGGMEKFVRTGSRVVVKPNIAWDRTPEQAANTHPGVVAAIVRMCKRAGASEILVLDNPCNPWNVTYYRSGIAEAVKDAGGVVKPPQRFRKVGLPEAQVLKEAEILEEVLDADLLINVPVVKVHGSQAKITVSMKNLMGTVKDRGFFHRTDLNRCIMEIAGYLKPGLTIIDASRILLSNGPAGPGMVKEPNIVAAGRDFVALDAFGADLLGIRPETVPHIQMAVELGLGEGDLRKIKIKYV